MRTGIVAFVSGVGLSLFLPAVPALPLWAYALFLLALSAPAWRYPVCRLPVFFILGCCWSLFRAELILSSSLPDELERQSLWLSGRVISIPEYRAHHIRFEFLVDALEYQGQEYPTPGKVRLVWYRHYPDLQAGQHYRLQARLKRPHGLMNPGGFDYEAWLFANRIRATGYVLNGQLLTGALRPLFPRINTLRQQVSRRLARFIPRDDPTSGFVLALAIGDRQWIGYQQWQTLNHTGTSHLMAISGLHIGLIAAFGFFLGRWCWSLLGYFLPVLLLKLPAPHAGALMGLLAAVLYAALAGFAIPAQRALIMVSIVMLSLYIGRRISLINMLLLALLLVILLDPMSLMSAGFWLSFAAVSVIAFGVFGRHNRQSLWQKIGHIHVLLALGLMPILLFFFAQVPLLSAIANFVAVPLVSLLVVPLVLSGSLISMSSEAGYIPLNMAQRLLSFLWDFLRWLDSLSVSVWEYALPDPLWLIPAIIGILILLMPRGLPGRWVGLVWLLPMLFVQHSAPSKGEFVLTLLDVGQGLSAVVRTEQHTLVFDAGAKYSEQFEMGGAVVAPFLRQQGISKIDTFLISHGDNDHIGGAAGLLKRIPAERILSSVPEALQVFPAQACEDGQHWDWDGVSFQIMQADALPVEDENDRSCVLKVTAEGGSLLLTGDIEIPAEQALIEKYGEAMQADILIVPHHGSKTSSSEAFLDKVKPREVLYPLGYRNRYGFPHPQVHARYQARGLVPISTAEAGAIGLRVGESLSAPESYRISHRRFWHATIR